MGETTRGRNDSGRKGKRAKRLRGERESGRNDPDSPQGSDRQPLGDKIFMSTEIHFAHLLPVKKKTLFEVCFLPFFMRVFFFFFFFQIYIAPGRGRQSIEDKNFMITERPFLFSHMLQVSKLSLRNLVLYTFFKYFIHVYSPEARTDKPLGSKF